MAVIFLTPQLAGCKFGAWTTTGRGVFPMTTRLLALVLALCFSSAAEAQNFWSIPGSGCVPDEAAIKFNRHKVDNLSVQHAAGNVEPIVLICPVLPFSTTEPAWVLQLYYQDSTGAGTAARVRAQLFQNQIGTGKPQVVATVSSNSSAVTTFNNINSASFPHTFEFDVNLYWVRVELIRSTADQTVIFYYAILTAV
jgi:hypothetical protein